MTDFVEKSDDPVTQQINAGCYVFRRRVVDTIPAGRVVSVERETFPGLVARRRGWSSATSRTPTGATWAPRGARRRVPRPGARCRDEPGDRPCPRRRPGSSRAPRWPRRPASTAARRSRRAPASATGRACTRIGADGRGVGRARVPRWSTASSGRGPRWRPGSACARSRSATTPGWPARSSPGTRVECGEDVRAVSASGR